MVTTGVVDAVALARDEPVRSEWAPEVLASLTAANCCRDEGDIVPFVNVNVYYIVSYLYILYILYLLVCIDMINYSLYIWFDIRLFAHKMPQIYFYLTTILSINNYQKKNNLSININEIKGNDFIMIKLELRGVTVNGSVLLAFYWHFTGMFN